MLSIGIANSGGSISDTLFVLEGIWYFENLIARAVLAFTLEALRAVRVVSSGDSSDRSFGVRKVRIEDARQNYSSQNFLN